MPATTGRMQKRQARHDSSSLIGGPAVGQALQRLFAASSMPQLEVPARYGAPATLLSRPLPRVIDLPRQCWKVFNYDQTQADVSFMNVAMAMRQCLECGNELVMAFHPSKMGQRSPGTEDPVMVTAKWRCGTCGLAFTSAELRAGKRSNSTVIPKKQ